MALTTLKTIEEKTLHFCSFCVFLLRNIVNYRLHVTLLALREGAFVQNLKFLENSL